MFSVGSGSTFAYSILETNYKYNMTDEEAANLGLKAVMHATHRDAMSGGIINVFLIKEDKIDKVMSVDNYEVYRNIYGGGKLPSNNDIQRNV